MMYRHILVCLSLVLFMPLSVKALPPASPAGGNYLALDGVDDYAVLDFQTFGRLLPNDTDEFTVEAWIYPTTPPDKNTALTIHSQQVSMLIVIDEFPGLNNVANALNIEHPKGALILKMNAHLAGQFGMTLSFPILLVPNQWHHIAYQSNGAQTITIVNNLVKLLPHGTPLGHDLLAQRPPDFVLGGYGKIIEVPVKNKWFYDSFIGYIDEVRISTVASYDVEKKGFMPRGAFKNDAKTVALWHFDEPGGTVEFSDASGNAYHLVGENGAKTGIPLAVAAAGKLATTWGDLSSKRHIVNLTVETVGKLRTHWGKLEVEYQNQPQRWTDARRVRKLLDDFYQQVATDTQLQSISHRLFSQVFYNYGLNHGPGLNCQGEDSHE